MLIAREVAIACRLGVEVIITVFFPLMVGDVYII